RRIGILSLPPRWLDQLYQGLSADHRRGVCASGHSLRMPAFVQGYGKGLQGWQRLGARRRSLGDSPWPKTQLLRSSSSGRRRDTEVTTAARGKSLTPILSRR